MTDDTTCAPLSPGTANSGQPSWYDDRTERRDREGRLIYSNGMLRYCDARTHAQSRSGSWGPSQIGCARRAQVITEDGHYACNQHAKKPPANGWN